MVPDFMVPTASFSLLEAYCIGASAHMQYYSHTQALSSYAGKHEQVQEEILSEEWQKARNEISLAISNGGNGYLYVRTW